MAEIVFSYDNTFRNGAAVMYSWKIKPWALFSAFTTGNDPRQPLVAFSSVACLRVLLSQNLNVFVVHLTTQNMVLFK